MSVANFVWKIVIGGMGGVGKTSFLTRYVKNEFIPDMKLTVGIQLHVKQIERHSKTISLSIWDLGGQTRFRIVQPEYIKGAVAALVMFDMSRINTLWEAADWIAMITENVEAGTPIFLVGGKKDLIEDSSELETINEQAIEFCNEHGLVGYVTNSALSNENIAETIDLLVDHLLWKATGGKLGADLDRDDRNLLLG